jgi:hypothetical protein
MLSKALDENPNDYFLPTRSPFCKCKGHKQFTNSTLDEVMVNYQRSFWNKRQIHNQLLISSWIVMKIMNNVKATTNYHLTILY